jgi:hypothetical protein
MVNEINEIESKYKEAVKKFVVMKVSNPKLSVRKFCDTEGIPHQSFDHLLIKHPIIWETILSETRKRYHLKSMDVDEALYKKALKGDPRAIELWYKHHEKWLPSQESAVTNIQILFAPGMMSEEEQNIVQMKKIGPTQIEGSKSGEDLPDLFTEDLEDVFDKPDKD